MASNSTSDVSHGCPALLPGRPMGSVTSEAELALLRHRLEELESQHEEHERQIGLLLKYSTVIDDIVKEQEARRKFWESIASSVTSAGAWAIIVAIGSAVWYTAQSKLGKP